ncbi:MAG: TolC family protein [Alistipes sp.]|nr:TolC family protein [Alistipes sp.]
MKKTILTVLLATAVMAAQAQLRLTLDEALDIALSENPTIKIADMGVARYDYVTGETRANLLPQLSVDGSYTRSVVKQEIAKGLSFGADNTLTATANLSLPLIAPTVWRTLKLNRTQLAAAVESARSSRINLAAEVKKAFYNVLLAEQSLAVLRASEADVQRTVDDTRMKYDNGLASEYDLLTAEVQLSNLQPTILQTENSIKVAKLMLKMYLSLPEEVEFDVKGSLDEWSAVVADAVTLSTDISQNSDLRTLDLQEELLKRQLKVANASRMPTIGAFATASYSGNDLDRSGFGGFGGMGDGSEAGTAAAISKNSFYWQHPVSVGVQISVPIFSGLGKSKQARSIKNQIAQIGLQKEYARKQVDVQVRSAINDLLTARETMRSQERTVEQAAKAYSISDTRFRAGAGTILELNSAQLAETQARLNYSQAIYDYLSAQADYEKILGHER